MSIGAAIALATTLVTTSGCLRYTPSHAEMTANAEGESPETDYLDPSAFEAYELANQRRLEAIISERPDASPPGVYLIGDGDLIELAVDDVPELNTTERVRTDGVISLSLVGDIKVRGMSESALQDELRSRLNTFMHKPQVHVFIKEYNAHRVSIIGAVARPGVYSLKRSNYSVFDLLSESGGKTERGGNRVLLIPASRSTAKPILPARSVPQGAEFSIPVSPASTLSSSSAGVELTFDDLLGNVTRPPLAVPLRSGDTVVVPESGYVQVDGEVLRPGSFLLSPRMTLLGSLASAGGVTYSADLRSVELIRDLGAGRRVLVPVNLEQIALRDGQDFKLRDGDVVRVPSDSGKFFTRQLVDAVNSLFRVGVTQSVP